MIAKNTFVRPERNSARPVRTIDSIYSREQMEFVLQRERARCDRTGEPMTMAAFHLIGPVTGRQLLRFRRILSSRVRLTDEIGWLDKDQLGVLLPGTDDQGAHRLVADVLERIRPYGLDARVNVMRYPAEQNAVACDLSDSRMGTSVDAATNRRLDGSLSRDDLMPFVMDGIAQGMSQHPATATLDNLLVRPLPWWKRVLDIIGASFGLVFFSSLLAAIAVVIRLTSTGPAIFSQPRTGLGGRPFTIYKFRTMSVDAEARKDALRKFSEQDGPAFKLTNDPRVTRLGRLLRTTSMDELPQLWNVLKGDMSLVGPRPLPIAEANGCQQWQRRRHDVTPGLTCLWQVEGRSSVSFTQWMRMDARYVMARNLMHDIKLILLTIPSVLMKKGAR